MKYVSIDIETTGDDPEVHQILSVAAIIEDTEKQLDLDRIPKFEIYFKHDKIVGHPVALEMNMKLIMNIQNEKIKVSRIEEFNTKLFQFLFENDAFIGSEINKGGFLINGKINVAGKNFAKFDLLFLNKIPGFKAQFPISARIIDPAVLYVNWQSDQSLPSLKTCKERSGLFFSNEVAHDAILDAWDVIRLLRKSY